MVALSSGSLAEASEVDGREFGSAELIGNLTHEPQVNTLRIQEFDAKDFAVGVIVGVDAG